MLLLRFICAVDAAASKPSRVKTNSGRRRSGIFLPAGEAIYGVAAAFESRAKRARIHELLAKNEERCSRSMPPTIDQSRGGARQPLRADFAPPVHRAAIGSTTTLFRVPVVCCCRAVSRSQPPRETLSTRECVSQVLALCWLRLYTLVTARSSTIP